VLVELIYTLTDPPIKLLQRVIPPIRVGQFDFQLTVVFLILFIAIRILSSLVLFL
jgi:YggT family protein